MDREEKKKKKRQEKQDKIRQKKLDDARTAPVVQLEKKKLGRAQIGFIIAIMVLACAFVFLQMSHPV